MPLEAIEPKNLLQRVRRLILGKEKPNFLTRVSCGVGFVIWIYLASWHILTLLALLLYPMLKNGTALVQSNFVRVGGRYSLGDDPISIIIGHAGIQIAIFILMLLGLILIYRRKKIGFLFYVFGGLASPLITIFLMSWTYFEAEVLTSYADILLLGGSIAYFGIGALIFYRKKDEPEAATA